MSNATTLHLTNNNTTTTMKTKLHTYFFNCGHIPQSQAYLKLRDARMKSESRRSDRIHFVSPDARQRDGIQFSHLTELSSGGSADGVVTTYEVDIDTKHLFDDQWNTASTSEHGGYRVFDWVEYYAVHTKSLIWGHWLEITDEMVDARLNTKVCKYCWEHYGTLHENHLTDTTGFCTQCLGNPYLKESDLHLLRLTPVSLKHRGQREDLTQEESEWLTPRYIEAQLRGSEARREAKMAEQRADLEKGKELNAMEYDGMTRLLDAGVDLTNVIFYKHYPLFKFGWRDKLSPSVAEAMQEKLREIEFPYPTEIAAK
jgi:hypothetical protein